MTSSIQIAVHVPNHESNESVPYDFQNLQVFVDIPETAKEIIFSGSADGSANSYVDDKVTILGPDGAVIFEQSYDVPSGVERLPPKNVTENFKGVKGCLTVTCRDLAKNYMGCSALWLTIKA